MTSKSLRFDTAPALMSSTRIRSLSEKGDIRSRIRVKKINSIKPVVETSVVTKLLENNEYASKPLPALPNNYEQSIEKKYDELLDKFTKNKFLFSPAPVSYDNSTSSLARIKNDNEKVYINSLLKIIKQQELEIELLKKQLKENVEM